MQLLALLPHMQLLALLRQMQLIPLMQTKQSTRNLAASLLLRLPTFETPQPLKPTPLKPRGHKGRCNQQRQPSTPSSSIRTATKVALSVTCSQQVPHNCSFHHRPFQGLRTNTIKQIVQITASHKPYRNKSYKSGAAAFIIDPSKASEPTPSNTSYKSLLVTNLTGTNRTNPASLK